MKPGVLVTLARGADTLAAALLDRADIDIIVMYRNTCEHLVKRGIPHSCLMDLVSPEEQQWASAEAERRQTVILEGLRSEDARTRYAAWRDDHAGWEVLCQAVDHTLGKRLTSEIIVAEALRRCASERDLRLVVVHQDLSSDMRVVIEMGHRLGIPSLHTPHGCPGSAVIPITLCGRPSADYLAVFSERYREIYESLHVPPERIFVTGNFEWDKFTKPPPPQFRRDLCRGLELDAGQPILVWALSYSHTFTAASTRHNDRVERLTDSVLDAFATLEQRHPDWQFVLRPHPNDTSGPAGLLEGANRRGIRNVRVDSFTSSVSCTAMADLVICCQSNLGIEAIIAGKPVVNCVIEEFGQAVYDEGIGRVYEEGDAVLNVHTVEDLVPAIEAALTDPATQQEFLRKRPVTIRRFNGVNDGEATERLVSLILRLMREGAKAAPPIERFPATEPALARMVPGEARRVLVVGRGAEFVADAVRAAQPGAAVESGISLDAAETSFDAIVLAEPVPHSCEADMLLRKARTLLAETGVVIAAFPHGNGSDAHCALRRGAWAPPREGFEASSSWGLYTRTGVDLVLSRCDLVPESIESLPYAKPECTVSDVADIELWVVRARLRIASVSQAAIQKQERVARANEANARGERSFAEGDYLAAASAFAEAIREFNQEALFFNNLGTVLHALGQQEQAWRRLLEAIHINPFLQSARGNLRTVAAVLGREDEAERILRLFGVDCHEETARSSS